MSHNEFPIVCDRCLGCDQSSSTSSSSSSQPPQIRMTKRTNGAECRYCQRVFTPFYWKKGALSMRTEICGVCATIRHLCQSCLLDMDLFVPQYVRDSAAMNENVAFQMIRDTTPTPTTAPHKKHPKHAQQQQQQQQQRSGVYRTDARQLLASQQSQQKLHQQSQVTTTFLAEQAEKMLTEGGLNSHLLLDQIAPSTSQLSNMLFSPPPQQQAQQQQIQQQNKNFTKNRDYDQQKHHHHRHQHQHRSRTHTTPYDRNRTSRTSGGSSSGSNGSNGSGNGGRMVDRATMERRQMIEFLKNPQRYLVLPPGVTPLLSTTEKDNVTSNSENNSENKDNNKSKSSNNDGNDQLPPVYPSMVSLPVLL